ncbi:MAG TPA: DUF6084 family protein [Acidimicrobiales bacterium]
MTSGLAFEVLEARAEPYAMAPTIVLRLGIASTSPEPVHAIALNCQIRIEPQRRTYDADEEHDLYDVFGETSQWARSLRPFLWVNVAVMVTSFTGRTETDLVIPCTYDMEVAGARYLHALRGGDIPIVVLFSGTVFGAGLDPGEGRFSARPVSWSDETTYRLAQAVWRGAMDQHFPNSAWLRLSHENLDALGRFRADRGLTTWDQTLERLFKEVGEP